MSLIKELKETQWYSQQKIEEMQLRKLKHLISYAYQHVLYYRNVFDQFGIIPGDIKTFEDYKNIPFLSKEDIQFNHQRFIADNAKNYNFVTTSGSTGTPLTYPTNGKTKGYHIANMAFARSWWGINSNDKQMLLWGRSGAMAEGKKGIINKIKMAVKDRVTNRLRCESYNLNDENLHNHYKKMSKFRPDFIYGFASSVYLFADFIRRKELDMDKFSLKGIIITSELIFDKERRIIESVFNAPVIDEYGMVEAGIIAYSCPEGTMHIMDPTIYVERIPVKNSKNSNIYEIVITPFSNFVAPLIRYKTRDLVNYTDSSCSCGRSFSVLGKLIGRIYDLIQTKEGKRIAGEYITDVLEYIPGIRQFQLIQENWSQFIFNIVKEPGIFKKDSEQKIVSKFKKILGDNISVSFKYVNSIASESSGKYKLVISKVTQRNN
ncbi:hypothetical protein GF312_16550 [Candidatus Poribacteria bacterium]|nr:hypothetical protein [Candidatus Poribacteria bacterium]